MAHYCPYDWDALAAQPDSPAWLHALIDQAIEREAITVAEIHALQAVVATATAADLAALRATFHGTDSELSAAMLTAWDTLESLLRRVPSPATVAFAQKMAQEGGYVGYDDQDCLIWTLPGGGTDVLVDADGRRITGTVN